MLCGAVDLSSIDYSNPPAPGSPQYGKMPAKKKKPAVSFSLTKSVNKAVSTATKVQQIGQILNPPAPAAVELPSAGGSFLSSGTGKLVLLGGAGVVAAAVAVKVFTKKG